MENTSGFKIHEICNDIPSALHPTPTSHPTHTPRPTQVHVILNDGHMLTQLKALVEQEFEAALLFMAQMLAHPTESEAVR